MHHKSQSLVLSVFLLLFFCNLYFAAPGDEILTGWNKTLESKSSYAPYSAAVDPSGNLYVVGPDSSGMSPVWRIKKFDSSGNEDTTNWNKSFDGGMNDAARAVIVDNESNVYVAGLITIGMNTGWGIKKFDSNGAEDTVNWNKTYFPPASSSDPAYALALDSQNNLYAVGSTSMSAAWWLKKFNSEGVEDTVNWNLTFSAMGTTAAYSVAIDSDDNVYVVGTNGQIGAGDWWLKKFSSSGVEDAVNWNKTFGGSIASSEAAYSVAVDSDNNIYVVGNNLGIGMGVWWLKKFDSNGVEDTVNWNITSEIPIAGSGDIPYSVVIDPMNRVYVVGKHYFDMSNNAWWVRSFNSSGSEDTRYNKSSAGGTSFGAYAAALDDNNNLYVVGVADTMNGYWVVKKFEGNGTASLSINTSASYSDSNTSVTFYAYYRNSTNLQLISGATCNITVNGSTALMAESASYYSYTLTGGFDSTGIKSWSVVCNQTGYARITTSSTLDVVGEGSEIVSGWNKTIVNSGGAVPLSDVAYSAVVDPDDNLYVVGKVLISGDSKWLIKKYNSAGIEDTSNWNKMFDQSNSVARAAALDSQENVYVVGSVGSNMGDWWLKKFNSSGDEDITNWNITTGGELSEDVAYAVAIDNESNVYVGGNLGQSWLIKKFNSEGVEDTVNWNKTFAFDGMTDYVTSMALDSDGNVYVVGRYENVNGFPDWLIKKFSSDGVEDIINWNKTFDGGASSNNIPYSVKVDSDGNVYVTGYMVIGMDDENWTVKKFDSNGVENLTWNISQSVYPSMDVATSSAYSLALDHSGNVFVVGASRQNSNDFIVKKFNSSAAEDTSRWNKTYDSDLGMGMHGTDIAYGAVVDSQNNLYVVGSIGTNNGDWLIKKFRGADFPPPALIVVNQTDPCISGDSYYSTIQAAINGASAGDTIIVCANGTAGYTENVNVDVSVNLYGNESGVLVNASDTNSAVIQITSNGVNITNFTIRDATGGFGLSILANNTYVWNCSAINNFYGFGVESSNNSIVNNSAFSNVYGGFLFSGSSASNNNLTFNVAHDNPNVDFHIVSSIGNNIISNNTVYNSDKGIYLDGSSDNNLTNNTAYNNARGISISGSSNSNSIYNNTLYDNSLNGVYATGGSGNSFIGNIIRNNPYGLYLSNDHNNIRNNTIYTNSQAGIYLDSNSYENNISTNTIHNHTVGLASGIYLDHLNAVNYIYDNLNIFNNTYGVYLDNANYTNITNNTLYNNSNAGAYLLDSDSNNLSSSTIYNNTQSGIYITGTSSGNRVFSNTIHNHTAGLASGIFLQEVNDVNYIYNNPTIENNSYGVYLNYSNLTTMYNNTLRFNDQAGVYLLASNNNTFNLNTLTNCSNGLSMSSSQYNLFANGSINNATDDSIYLNDNSNTFDSLIISTPRDTGDDGTVFIVGDLNTFNNVTINQAGASGFFSYGGDNNVFTSNTVKNATYGFHFAIGSSDNNLSSNNASNNSIAQYYFNNSNATFTGDNYAQLVPASAALLTSYNDSIVTANVDSTYYFLITDNSNFSFVNATNVTFYNTTTNMTEADVTETTCASSSYTCQLVSDAVLELSNNSGSASVTELVLNYNSSKLGSHSESAIQLSKYSSGWVQLGATEVDTTNKYVRYGSLSSFSRFAAVAFTAVPSTQQSSSGSSYSKKYPTIAKTFNCTTGKLEATVTYSGSAISGLTVKLFYAKDFSSVSGTTDSNGKVSFTVTTDGNYELDTSATSDYYAKTLGPFDLTSCNAVPPTQVITTTTTTGTTEENTSETTEPTTPSEEITSTVEVTQEQAFTALSSADSAISAAAKAGKDVSAAKVKLNAANEALAAGNYAQAKTLAAEAETLAKNAKAASTAPVTQPTTMQSTPTKQQGMDMGTILLILVVIVVVVVGIYYLTKGKSSKGFRKGQRKV